VGRPSERGGTAGTDRAGHTGSYEWLRKRRLKPVTESTAQSYVMMVRGFLNHLLRQNKLRDNPARDVELATARKKRRRLFCERELAERLLINCPDRELKFILF